MLPTLIRDCSFEEPWDDSSAFFPSNTTGRFTLNKDAFGADGAGGAETAVTDIAVASRWR